MNFGKRVLKHFRRKSQQRAKGRPKSDVVEDEAAKWLAEIKAKIQDRNFQINTHPIWSHMNENERDAFSALFEKPEDWGQGWWRTRFEEIWSNFWATGSGSKRLMEKNGYNVEEDALEIRC